MNNVDFLEDKEQIIERWVNWRVEQLSHSNHLFVEYLIMELATRLRLRKQLSEVGVLTQETLGLDNKGIIQNDSKQEPKISCHTSGYGDLPLPL